MKILHPTDFSECAAKAEAMAVDLASKLDGEIILLQVLVETPLYGEGLLNAPTVQRVYDAQRKWSRASCVVFVALTSPIPVSASTTSLPPSRPR